MPDVQHTGAVSVDRASCGHIWLQLAPQAVNPIPKQASGPCQQEQPPLTLPSAGPVANPAWLFSALFFISSPPSPFFSTNYRIRTDLATQIWHPGRPLAAAFSSAAFRSVAELRRALAAGFSFPQVELQVARGLASRDISGNKTIRQSTAGSSSGPKSN